MWNHAISHFPRVTEPPTLMTLGGTASSFAFWGLHLSDIGVIVSSLASVCGVGLQFYVAMSRAKAAKRQQETRQDGWEDPD